MEPVKRPDLALRVAVAGKRVLGAHTLALPALLAGLFETIERRLTAVRDEGSGAGGWYSPAPPKITLVSGLADGTDQIAASAFLSGARPDGAQRAIGAILPFRPETFRVASPMANEERFEQLLAAAAYVVELDPDVDHAVVAGYAAHPRRIAGYRAQAEVMLHHADLLIAVDDATPGGEGGTLETTRRALDAGMPVIRLVLGENAFGVLRSADALDDRQAPEPGWQAAVEELVDSIVAVPGAPPPAADGHHRTRPDVVAEFFGAEPLRPRWRQALWRLHERRFRRDAAHAGDAAAPPLEPYRLRANELNRHYASLYSGTFLIGYVLAVVAVVLAGLALVVLLMNPTAHSPDHPAWWGLLVLGLAKLGAVIWIQRASRSANTRGWSERAVDYRYLAEALRAMSYLPRAGCFRPPQPLSVPFATRVIVQGHVDRLFQALVRQVHPAEITPPAAGTAIRPDARRAVEAIRTDWLAGQAAYHRRNATALSRMSRSLERTANALGITVILIVCFDLILLVAGGLHWLPADVEAVVYDSAPWLLFLAAILPAAVASLNGIRFQSECARLADRSVQMVGILAGFDRRAAALEQRLATGVGIRRLPIIDALRLADEIGRLTLDEVADWSALYAKDIVEP
ncbi:MAG: hypothetical protein KIS96_02775 [Bauldia sp.]|nr:hypothetical protein [Bauldia sp.]